MNHEADLQRDVLDELRWEPGINAAHVGVTVRQSVVTLSGHVASYSEKYAAEQAVARVHGVRAVANELEVRLPGELSRTDEDIAAACVTALRQSWPVPEQHLEVVVDGGHVTLSGEVEWRYQREVAEAAVRHVPGIRGLVNLVLVKPRLSTEEVRERIKAAFQREARSDASGILIEAVGNKVILHGSVRSAAEREDAQRIARATPGVLQVENDLTIVP